MTEKDAKVGTRVRALQDFSGVPRDTEGIIDEDYGSGVTVAWDLPGQPIILREGFNKSTELHYLARV